MCHHDNGIQYLALPAFSGGQNGCPIPGSHLANSSLVKCRSDVLDEHLFLAALLASIESGRNEYFHRRPSDQDLTDSPPSDSGP